MKHSKAHSIKGFFLLLLTVTVFLSSAGLYYANVKTEKEITKKVSSEDTSKEEKVTASPTFEAVVVSLIHHDFAKEILFYTFDFFIVVEKAILPSQRFVVSEKYFRTLFTHFISPNAP
jgi:hypothetical protein